MADKQTREQRLERALRDLIYAYVNTLENGRDRILFLGGDCDPVDVMERGDARLNAAKAALAAAPAVAPAQPGWQPIETAPKGRTMLVAYRNKLGKWRRVMACYYTADAIAENWETDDTPEGWYETSETHCEELLPTEGEPELWHELPVIAAAPPSQVQPTRDLLALAKQCGATSYTNRHLPGEPAVAFGNESWARFCAALRAGSQVQPTEALLRQARAWWESKRPLEYNLREHQQNPSVNCHTRAEEDLARAISAVDAALAAPATWPESVMQAWDYWRREIANGNTTSAPRDWFESLARSRNFD